MTIGILLISVIIIILLTTKWNLHPFLALIAAALFYALITGMSYDTIISSINEGFGGTLGSIGLIIVLGVIIGAFLEHSGGAFTLAEFVIKVIGKNRLHAAMGIIGFIVSIPVFFDSGFILLNPLNKSLTKRVRFSLAGTGIALMLGLMTSHVLVPPTPGPIAAAGILGADVGLVMLVGLAVGIMTLFIVIFYAKKYADKTYLEPIPEMSDEEIEKKITSAPSASKSFLPIIIPIILIVAKSLIDFSIPEGERSNLIEFIRFIGTPVIALLIGMLISFTLPKKFDKEMLSTSGWFGKALGTASNILLITGAGGIFGKILQNSDIANSITDLLSGANLGIWLPFLLAAAIKTAQGSSTVALITAASIMAPLMTSLGFDSEMQKALVVIAIGAGAAVVSHTNDSGFWVVTQFSGMDVKTGLRLYTFGSLIIGLSAAAIVFLISIFV